MTSINEFRKAFNMNVKIKDNKGSNTVVNCGKVEAVREEELINHSKDQSCYAHWHSFHTPSHTWSERCIT